MWRRATYSTADANMQANILTNEHTKRRVRLPMDYSYYVIALDPWWYEYTSMNAHMNCPTTHWIKVFQNRYTYTSQNWVIWLMNTNKKSKYPKIHTSKLCFHCSSCSDIFDFLHITSSEAVTLWANRSRLLIYIQRIV